MLFRSGTQSIVLDFDKRFNFSTGINQKFKCFNDFKKFHSKYNKIINIFNKYGLSNQLYNTEIIIMIEYFKKYCDDTVEENGRFYLKPNQPIIPFGIESAIRNLESLKQKIEDNGIQLDNVNLLDLIFSLKEKVKSYS